MAHNMTPHAVAVVVSDKPSINPAHEQLMTDVANLFAEQRWTLIYGGTSRGLMGTLGRKATSLGVSCQGVILRESVKDAPSQVVFSRDKLPDYGKIDMVDDLFTQKKRMEELSGGCLVLPGGFDALEMFTELRMWSELGVAPRPIVIVNLDGFWNDLIQWVMKAKNDGFITEQAVAAVQVVEDVEKIPTAFQRGQAYLNNKSSNNTRSLSYSILIPEGGEEEQLFRVFDSMARRTALTTQYSTFHPWKHFNGKIKAKDDLEMDTWRVWHDADVSPYGDSVGLACRVFENIQCKLMDCAALCRYTNQLETLACPASPDTPDVLSHVVVVLRLEQYCLVVDLVHYPGAIKVPLGDYGTTNEWIEMNGYARSVRYHYSKDLSSRHQLKMEKVTRRPTHHTSINVVGPAVTFSELSYEEGLERITFREAIEVDDAEGRPVPTVKHIVLRSVMPYTPQCIPALQDGEDSIITNCRLEINFERKLMLLQVPNNDWLLKHRQADFLTRLLELNMLKYLGPQKSRFYVSVANVVLWINDDTFEAGTQCFNKWSLFVEVATGVGFSHDLLVKALQSVRQAYNNDLGSRLGSKGKRKKRCFLG